MTPPPQKTGRQKRGFNKVDVRAKKKTKKEKRVCASRAERGGGNAMQCVFGDRHQR